MVGKSRGGEAGQVASALPQIAGQRGEVRRGLKEGWRGKWGEAESQAEAEVGMSGTRSSWGPCVQTSNQSGPGIPPIAWAGARHTQARGGPLGGPALPAAGLAVPRGGGDGGAGSSQRPSRAAPAFTQCLRGPQGAFRLGQNPEHSPRSEATCKRKGRAGPEGRAVNGEPCRSQGAGKGCGGHKVTRSPWNQP